MYRSGKVLQFRAPLESVAFRDSLICSLPDGYHIHVFLFHVSLILAHGMCILVSSVRCERLEDQLNDLTELHQNETTNLKQELASIEEKVAYQAYERARDMQVHAPRTYTQQSV